MNTHCLVKWVIGKIVEVVECVKLGLRGEFYLLSFLEKTSNKESLAVELVHFSRKRFILQINCLFEKNLSSVKANCKGND